MDERDIIHIGSKLRAVVDGGLMGDNDELLTSYNHVASRDNLVLNYEQSQHTLFLVTVAVGNRPVRRIRRLWSISSWPGRAPQQPLHCTTFY